jgi:hypothetical protein
MVDMRERTVSYRLAEYFSTRSNTKTLEDYVKSAFKKLPNPESWSFRIAGQFFLEGRHKQHSKSVGYFIHIAAFTEGESASVVPSYKKEPGGDLSTLSPPEDVEFLDGDLMFLVSGNHVIICGSNLHETYAQHFLEHLFDAANLGDDSWKFTLVKKANIDKVRLIQKQGVDQINLDASLYDTTLDHQERTSLQRKIGGRLWDEIAAVFSDDERLQDVRESENLVAHLVVKFDKRKKGGEIGRERLQRMANELVKDGDDGFKIVTGNGQVLGSDDVVLKKKISLQRHGKTVDHVHTWHELDVYFSELKSSGLLEQ